MISHGDHVEAEYKEGVHYLWSQRTAEKYMNTDAIDVEDRAAGTRMSFHHCSIAQFAITINRNVCPHIQVLNTLMRESYA